MKRVLAKQLAGIGSLLLLSSLYSLASLAGTTTLVNVNSGGCLGVVGASTKSNADIEQVKCSGASGQNFGISLNSDGSYTFTSPTTAAECMNAYPSSAGTDVNQYSCNATAAQKFQIVELYGNYQIKNSAGTLCLAVTGASKSVGALIELATCGQGKEQQFRIAGLGSAGSSVGVTATPANTFLNSLGVNTHISQGYNSVNYITPLTYLGVRQIRDSIGNLSSSVTVHQKTGVKLTINAGGDLTDLISAGRTLAAAGALLAFEGPNEPNNFPITYNGVSGGGSGSWVAVADFQRDLYSQVKADSTLKVYPVFGPSETGAETDNVGLQFLTIPSGYSASLPAGTKFADYVNPHNYVSSTQSNLYVDNQAWQCADPALNAQWDGTYGDNVVTWNKHFTGYTTTQIETVPKVTTETGWDSVSNPGGPTVQGKVLVNNYLAQFKRGWSYTFIYELIDGEGSTGNQGLYTSSYTAKPSANYIHNLTTVLADTKAIASPGKLNYSIASEPATVHDLLIQKSNGAFELVVWGESVSATNNITVSLGGTHATVNVYDVTVGTTATKKYSNVSSVPLSMTDHALIVEVIN